ncbi:hypothetical protein MLD52_06950 [Puniceicoccaceae bacterium K14]|nr:hypothetical protein [Puniceicoccaceae bacterium K14]
MNTFLRRTMSVFLLAIGFLSFMPSQLEASYSRYKEQRTWNIDRPGSYALRWNINVREGDAIVITASNVTLNLNGYSVSTRTRGAGRGIAIEGAQGVKVFNGKVSGFNVNVSLEEVENVDVSGLQITGDGLAPDGGPSEIGILLLQARSCSIRENNVSSVNLGVFVRGAESTGNRIEKNVIVGSTTDANNLLGICYNPAPGGVSAIGPSGDSIYNNHIARFNFAVSVSEESFSNLFVDNTFSSFTGAFRLPEAFEALGGTNAEFDNASTVVVTAP